MLLLMNVIVRGCCWSLLLLNVGGVVECCRA